MSPHNPDPPSDTPAVGGTAIATPSYVPPDPGQAAAPTGPAGDRYRLGAEIARGGMGAVLRATDTALGREVAVKVLQDKYAPASGTARRFFDEARITGQLQHPNIPAVHDLGTLPDGRPFLAMKLIKGDTLDDLLKARRDLAADRGHFIGVFQKVCEGVAYAHAHGVLHRDLKPANVMVGAFGEVQVMDWGLAKVLTSSRETASSEPDPDATAPNTAIVSQRDSDDLQTQAGSVLGTPAYMPPEQAIGAVDQVDRRSDVFGLGGILAAVLTGRPPFEGPTAESTRQQAANRKLGDCFARLDGCGAEPELVALAKRCLAGEQADRPADADAVAKSVAALRAAADERARRAELDRAAAELKAAEWRKRRRVWAGLAAAVAAAAAGGWLYDRQLARAAADRAAVAAEVDRQLAAGLAAARANDLDAGVAGLTAVVGLCERVGGADGRKAEAAEAAAAFARLRRFRGLAAAALTDAHETADRETGRPLRAAGGAAADEALAVYAVAADPGWAAALAASPLAPEQVREVRRAAGELLTLAAVRLLVGRGRGDPDARRAVEYANRAEGLDGPTVGSAMLRMLAHRRLKEDPAADAAGEQMSALAKAGGLKSARDLYLVGLVQLYSRRPPAEAQKVFERVLKLEPDHFGAQLAVFDCQSRLKNPRGTLAPLAACLALRPADPRLYYFRGMAHFELKEYTAAFDDFDAAVARDPGFAVGHFYRGRMRVVTDKWAEAETDFGRAVELDPGFTQAVSWRAVARAKAGRPAEAAADADLAAGREPADPLTLYFAARAYAQAAPAGGPGYAEKAVGLLRRALAAGFTDVGRLAPGGDFDPVRDRPDFRQLLAGREPAPKPRPAR